MPCTTFVISLVMEPLSIAISSLLKVTGQTMPRAMFITCSTVIEVQTWNEESIQEHKIDILLQWKGKFEMEGQTKIDKYHITKKSL